MNDKYVSATNEVLETTEDVIKALNSAFWNMDSAAHELHSTIFVDKRILQNLLMDAGMLLTRNDADDSPYALLAKLGLKVLLESAYIQEPDNAPDNSCHSVMTQGIKTVEKQIDEEQYDLAQKSLKTLQKLCSNSLELTGLQARLDSMRFFRDE